MPVTQSSGDDPRDDATTPEPPAAGATNVPAPIAGRSDQGGVAPATANATPVVLANVEAIARPIAMSAPRMSHVEISFDMAAGARLQFVVEAVPAGELHPGEQSQPILIRTENLTPATQLAAPAQSVAVLSGGMESAAAVAETAPPAPVAMDDAPVGVSEPPAAPAPVALLALSAQPGEAPVPSPSSQPQSLSQALADARTGLRVRMAGLSALLAPTAPASGTAAPAGADSRRWLNLRTWSLDERLFTLGLVLYLITRLGGIASFPIFFYSDEANNVLLGRQVVQNGFRGQDGTFLPIYFEADQNRWTPVLPTYLQAVTSFIFGSSILVARTTNALISLGAAIALSLILKYFFKLRFWWAGGLLLAIVPSWFMYSRTVFETVFATTCYAGFLLFYLLYRCRAPKYLYGAMLFGAAAFYAYSNVQLTVLGLGSLMLITDAKYHWANRQTLVRALPLVAVLVFPAVWFRLHHPTAIVEHLQAIDSYWVHDIPISQKLSQYVSTYLYGLSPQYWIPPNNGETTILPNQHFAGQGQLGLLLFALGIVGAGVAVRRLRSSAPHRIVLFAALAAPAGAALDSIEIARVLIFVVPAVLLAVIGLDWLLGLSRRINYAVAALAVFGVAGLLSLGMLRSALVDGPTWTKDYGLYGLQYGTKQIFEDTLPVLLRDDPSRKFIVSTTWANNVPFFVEFFLPPSQRQQVTLGNIDDYLQEQNKLADNTIFVMTAAEYGRVQSSTVMTTVQMLRQLAYPDGGPAFFMAQVAYVPDAAAQFAALEVERNKPKEGSVTIDGQSVRVLYSPLGDGNIQNVFDGNPGTLARGAEANPFIIELHFPQPRAIAGLSVKVSSNPDFSVTAMRATTEGGQFESITQRFVNQPPDPQADLAFASPEAVAVLRIEVKFNAVPGRAQIHIWEVGLH